MRYPLQTIHFAEAGPYNLIQLQYNIGLYLQKTYYNRDFLERQIFHWSLTVILSGTV